MTLLLLASLAACDRQSPPAGQAAANGETPAPITSGEATGSSASGKGEFSYTLDRSKAGTPAPDLTFQTLDGNDTTLPDFAGKPLLVNLWATWCAPCVAEMPTLDAVAAAYGPKGLSVVAVSQDSQGGKIVQPFFAKQGFKHLKSWIDPENQLGFHYATGMLPTTILYNAQGKEVARVIGAMDWNGKEAHALIAEAMQS